MAVWGPVIYLNPNKNLCGHFEIILENKNYLDDFKNLASTFKFIK
jgi:hypothetical protein